MVDLHVHSTKSDGTLSPTELVDYAVKKGLKAFALTDHDTVDGLDEAISYAEKLRQTNSEVPEIIPGIEFSTEYMGREVHVVGLYIDYKSPVFTEYLNEFVNSRETRNEKMCQIMTKAGMPMDYSEIKARFPDAVITRSHFAKYILEKGYAKSRDEVFERYIGDGRPYYVPREHITPMKAFELILRANGIPVFAHPILCKLSDSNLERFIKDFKAAGLIAIEALYSTYTKGEENKIRRFAEKYHLLLSGGSDFHGANKKGIDLGVGYGKLNIGDTILSEIKKRRKNLLFSDMDGTLLLSDCTVSEAMKSGIKRMTANGHKLILTSGRPLPSIHERLINFGFDFPNTYIIATNGSVVYDVDNDRIIMEKKITTSIIKRVTEICNEMNVHVHSYTDKEIVGYSEDAEICYYRTKIHLPFIRTNDIADYLKHGAPKILIIDLNDKNKLYAVRDRIAETLSGEVDTFFSNDKYLEVLPKGANKGSAVKFLESYLSYPHSHTYAAGDENNDIPMIEAAAHGIAMANAPESVKKAAEIVTKEDNNHDGLLEIINKYFN